MYKEDKGEPGTVNLHYLQFQWFFTALVPSA